MSHIHLYIYFPFPVNSVDASINVISVSPRTFTVTCTSNGGRALDITVTGPSGMVTTGAISPVGTPGRIGNDRFSATTDTITGGSTGDIYQCTASNGVSTDVTGDIILRGDILYMYKLNQRFVYQDWLLTKQNAHTCLIDCGFMNY